MKDMDTMKPLTNTQISKLLLREYNLSVSDESVGKILEDIERDTWNLHYLCIIKFVRNIEEGLKWGLWVGVSLSFLLVD